MTVLKALKWQTTAIAFKSSIAYIAASLGGGILFALIPLFLTIPGSIICGYKIATVLGHQDGAKRHGIMCSSWAITFSTAMGLSLMIL